MNTGRNVHNGIHRSLPSAQGRSAQVPVRAGCPQREFRPDSTPTGFFAGYRYDEWGCLFRTTQSPKRRTTARLRVFVFTSDRTGQRTQRAELVNDFGAAIGGESGGGSVLRPAARRSGITLPGLELDRIPVSVARLGSQLRLALPKRPGRRQSGSGCRRRFAQRHPPSHRLCQSSAFHCCA